MSLAHPSGTTFRAFPRTPYVPCHLCMLNLAYPHLMLFGGFWGFIIIISIIFLATGLTRHKVAH